jgi:hypothetical protein
MVALQAGNESGAHCSSAAGIKQIYTFYEFHYHWLSAFASASA